jgi:hypothetical protein
MNKAILTATCLGFALLAQTLPAHAQNLVPEDTADLYPLGPTLARGVLGQPRSLGRLFVQLDVVPTCTFGTGGVMEPVLVRCTRGVPYRARILDDADAAFGLTQVFAPRAQGQARGLVRIEAERLDVEF